MIRSITVTSLFAALMAFAGTALAQQQDRRDSGGVLLLERSQVADRSMDLPRRGLSMTEVERRFGAPSRKHAAVGGNRPQHPPITRWTYPEFSVYFERSTVIDAVANRLDRETGPKPVSR